MFVGRNVLITEKQNNTSTQILSPTTENSTRTSKPKRNKQANKSTNKQSNGQINEYIMNGCEGEMPEKRRRTTQVGTCEM
jgi:hypothetical protein